MTRLARPTSMTPWGILLAALSPCVAGSAAAAEGADVARGHALARAWCASCHAVEPGAEAAFADIPEFSAVARMPSTTSPALHAFLSTPHGDMPDIKLKKGQIDAVVAYILSLKGK
jgi:mono/diheme cytochrome c family protein